MKKALVLFILLYLLCSISGVYAADTSVTTRRTLSAVGASDALQPMGSQGLRYHEMSWSLFGGTLSACSLDLEGSMDGITWTNIIANQDCSSSSSSSVVNSLARQTRLYVNTYTIATGTPKIDVTHVGSWDNPSTSSATMQGVVSYAGSAFADGSTQTARLVTDSSIAIFAQGKVNTSAPTYSDGDIKPLSITGSGALRVDPGLVVDTAHGATFSEAPVGIGLEGLSTERAAVDATDKVKAVATTSGAVVVQSGALPGDFFEYSAETTDTAWHTILAPSADYYYVVTYCKVINADASVGTKVTIYEDDDGDIGDAVERDGGYAASLGGGWTNALGSGLFSTHTANRGLYVVCTSDSSETHVTVRGYRTKIKPVM